MTARWRPGDPLAERRDLSALVRDWLSGSGPGAVADEPDAAVDMRRFLAGETPTSPAPAWRAADWFDAWRARQIARQPDTAVALDALAAGDADVVVTGQQPGFLGGPLYSLLKAATCVAAAEARTRAGRLTVPVFWSGDDDDDVDEALAVSVWDPRRRRFLRPRRRDEAEGRRIGALPGTLFGAAERAWLAERSGTAAAALRAVIDEALADGCAWGELHVRLLTLLLGGRGLLTVSGDDGAMLDVAAPLASELTSRADELADLAARRGAALTARGHHAQIGAASLARPFHRTDDDRRLRLGSATAAADVPPAELRTGVLFRSLVQDWLLSPAGVVVGPGERAYLEQLRPLYAALGIARAPLLPRLHLDLCLDLDGCAGPDARSAAAAPVDDAVDRVVETATAVLADELAARGAADAPQRAAAATARWRDRVRRTLAAVDAGDEGPSVRDWRDPPAGPQERVLPVLWAAALREGLADDVLDAAVDHLSRLADGDPRAYRLEMDPLDPEDSS